MSKFHSSMSRRDFMKALGLAGAGVGAAAATAPVFHDLDEVISSAGLQKHPWYVKERELLDPTTEVDWSIMARYDRRQQGQCARVQAIYYGEDRVRAASENSGAIADQQLQSNKPGFGLKWEALRQGFERHTRWRYGSGTYSVPLEPSVSGDVVPMSDTPEELGVPKWTGTPEEGSKLLVAATRLYGVGEIGFAELDSTYRNKIVAVNHKGNSTGNKWIGRPLSDISNKDARPLVYEDVPEGYQTDDKLVIPTSQQYVLYLAGPEPRETDRTAISRMSKSNLVTNSTIRNQAFWSTLNFLRTLGYSAIGGIGHGNDAFNSGAVAILTGKSETSRMSNWPISFAYGPRAYDFTQIVDLPVEPTHPADAGIWRFCQTCGICADVCPSNSIPTRDDPDYPDGPRYDMPLIEGKPDTQHAPGPKLFWYNGSSCRLFFREGAVNSGCSLCAAECAFSTGTDAIIHDVVKSVVATTGIFNGFMSNMSRTFGYGTFEDPEEWWDLSLPMYGIDSTVTAIHGGYSK